MEGSEVGAAFGLVQLKSLEENIISREKNLVRQNSFFGNYPEYFYTPMKRKGSRTGFLAFPVLISASAPFSRKQFQIYLEERNIQTRVCFTGNILRQPMMRNIGKRVASDGCPNADAVMERGVLLPLHHGMTDEMFERLHDVIQSFLKKF